MEKVADAVMKHEGLDVIALQEVHRAQVTELALQLKKKGFGDFYTHFFTMKDCGDSGKDFGLAFLSRTPISTSILFKPRAYVLPHAPKPCDRELNRILAAITTQVRGKTVRVYNTHLSACGGTSIQRKQADEIISTIKIEEIVFEFFDGSRSSFRPILMGDMNAPPSRGAHSILTERFIDAWGNRGGGLTFPTRDLEARIDYIFVGRGDFRVDDITVTSNQSLVNTFNIPGINKPEDLPKPPKDPKAPEPLQPIPDHLPVTARLSFD
jgi:endonuclease/exonuclease/phosphatase family metal-dependent hydrolase